MYLYHNRLKPLDHTQVISNHDVTVQGGEYLSKQVCCYLDHIVDLFSCLLLFSVKKAT